MAIYYVILLSVYLLYKFINKKNLYIDIIFFILIFISSFRGERVGGDLINYIPLYEEISRQDWKQIFQESNKYGYIFCSYIKLWSYISSSPVLFLIGTSIINLSIIAFFIKKYSKIPWLSIYIYIAMGFYTNTFNSVRSSMALAFGALCIHYIIQKKFPKFLICFLIALEIHKTIFPLLFLYPLTKFNLSWKYMFIMVGGAITISYFLPTELINILAILYASSYATLEDTTGGGFSLFILLFFITFVSYYFLKNRLDRVSTVLLHTMLLSVCIQAFAPHFALVTRIASFFNIYMIILIPNLIEGLHYKSNQKCAIVLACILSFCYFQYFIMTPTVFVDGIHTNSQLSIPYKFIWD